MLKFFVKRLFYGFLVLLGVIVIVFFLFNVLPGDPARMTLGQRADVASLEAVKKDLGLDKPLYAQFLIYLNDLSFLSVHSNSVSNIYKYNYNKITDLPDNRILVFKVPYLRRSYQSQKLVIDILFDALPGTIILATTSIILASIFGIFLGVLAAIKQHSVFDNTAVLLSVFGISLPSYFSGIILAWLFGYVLHEITGLDMSGSLYDIDPVQGRVLALQNLILPAITLGIRPLAIIVQLTRSAMLDIISRDYVRTAVAKGLRYRVVLFKHALRNALNPVVTAISGWFASLLAGAFFVEFIFNWKGIGYVTVKALEESDFPVVMGSVLVTATIFVLVNIAIDIFYGVLDPRVSIKGKSS